MVDITFGFVLVITAVGFIVVGFDFLDAQKPFRSILIVVLTISCALSAASFGIEYISGEPYDTPSVAASIAEHVPTNSFGAKLQQILSEARYIFVGFGVMVIVGQGVIRGFAYMRSTDNKIESMIKKRLNK